MSDRSRGQPWDPSVTLTYEKLAQDRLPKIKEVQREAERMMKNVKRMWRLNSLRLQQLV